MSEGSFLQEFIAGNVGGLAGIVTVYPLDTLKIRQQTSPNSGSMKDVFLEMKSHDGV
jgi:solute carrier family 25 (mitochondrial carnitine/acylcarnitine transporter), member 20/29